MFRRRRAHRAVSRVAALLVFGSLSTPAGILDRPAIRFLHPENGGTSDTLLWTTTIAAGQRFYAVLHAPPDAEYLDRFLVEAGSGTSGFDRIYWTHLRKDQEPLAMYVGEIEDRPALNRAAPGQKVVVETREDFQNAQRELRHFYPAFDGTVISTTRPRNSALSR